MHQVCTDHLLPHLRILLSCLVTVLVPGGCAAESLYTTSIYHQKGHHKSLKRSWVTLRIYAQGIHIIRISLP